MKTVTSAALAISAAAAVLTFGTAAEAQYYPYPPQGYYYPQPPSPVPPHIARKQAQLSKRFVEKYGYVQPAPTYNYGYQPQPRYYQPQPRYYQPQPQYYPQRQYYQYRQGYSPGGSPLSDR